MNCNSWFFNMAAGACLMALTGMVHAGETVHDFALPSLTGAYTDGSRSFMLASNDEAVPQPKERAIQATPAAEFEPPMFSRSNAHKYMGLSTLALVVATALAPKPEEDAQTQAQRDAQQSSTHAKLGRAAATMAAATATSGLLAHWDDFHLEDGWADPDNMHAMLGTAGALAMLFAVSQAPGGGHAGVGMAGGVAMGVAVKLTW